MSPRILRLKTPLKGGKGADRCKTALEEGRLNVCFAEQNRLAAQYLLRILGKDSSLYSFSLQDLVVHAPIKRVTRAFILDRYGVDMPVGECLQVLRKKYPGARFVVIDEERAPVETAQLLSLGVHAFVEYRHIREQLTQAIHSVIEGKLWVPATVLEAYARRSISSLNMEREKFAPGQCITQRESQIIEFVKRRLSNREIRAMSNITESTVKFHLSNIFSKLQVKRRRELQDQSQANDIWQKLMASWGDRAEWAHTERCTRQLARNTGEP